MKMQFDESTTKQLECDPISRRSFISSTAGLVGALATGSLLVSKESNAETAPSTVSPKHPVRLDPKYLAGKGLDTLQPWPAAMILRPIATHRVVQWYTGEKLSCMVYDADDGLIKFTDLPYDEQCMILNGTATLTSVDGIVQVFQKGDVFVAPKGWTGTWELKGGYREMITFETKSLDYAMAKWFDQK